MKYYVYDKRDNTSTEYSTWWDLLAYFSGAFDNFYSYHGVGYYTYRISHNDNDTMACSKIVGGWDEHLDKYVRRVNIYYEKLPLIVYDSNNTIVNKREILDGLKSFDPEKYTPTYKRNYWRYKGWNSKKPYWKSYRHSIRKNKRYAAEFLEYDHLFPHSGRYSELKREVGKYWDDYSYRTTGRSWKDQSKKRKQWM